MYFTRFLTGSRVLETHIYKHLSYPFDLIAPITVMWNPQLPQVDPPPLKAPSKDQASTADEGLAGGSKRKKKKGKGKGKGKGKETEQAQLPEADTDPLPSDMKLSRAVWIRIHPAVFDDVLATLQTASSFALRTVKRDLKLQEDKTFEVEIVDLRGQLNVFEIMGPKSSQVIQGALVPVDDQREEFKKVRSPDPIPRYYSDALPIFIY
jgi:ribonuclease P/MRP protein subunit POP1